MATQTQEVLLRIDADIKGLVTKVAAGREELTKLKNTQSELTAKLKELAKAGDTTSETYQHLAKELALVDGQIQAQNKSIRSNQLALERTITANATAEGSLVQLRAQLSAANSAWDKLTELQRENSDEGRALQASISQITDKLKDQEAQTGRNQRNVGNYKSALEDVKDKLLQLSELKAEINRDGFENAQNALDDINAGITKLATDSQKNFEKIQADLLATGKTAIDQAGSMKELTQLMKEYRDASLIATGQASEDFKKLASVAEGKLGDIKKEIKNLASDTSAFDAITQGANTVVASYTLIQGASQLFGKQNDNVERAIQKTTASLAVLNSVTQITNALQKESSLVVKATALAQTVWNASVGGGATLIRLLGLNTIFGATALNVFSKALAVTGIGALVVGIGLLVANFSKVTGFVSSFVDKVENAKGVLGALLIPVKAIIAPFEFLYNILVKVGEALGILDSAQVKGLKDQIDILVKKGEMIGKQYDFERQLAEAAGKDTKRIESEKLKAQSDNIKAQIENLIRLQQANGELNDDQKKKLEELKDSWKQNFQDRAVLQANFDKDQIDKANATSVALLNIELRKQALLGGDQTAKKKELAEKEYNIAIAAARKKGEDTKVIEANYNQQILEIDKESADKRFNLNKQLQQILIDSMIDGRDKELAQEKLNLEDKLRAVKGFSTDENRQREALREQSRIAISKIDKKYAQLELDDFIAGTQRKLTLEANASKAESELAIATAKTAAEKQAALIKSINDDALLALKQFEIDKQSELNNQDKLTEDELTKLRATGEFKAMLLRDQKAAEAKIIQDGLDAREQIQRAYDAKELAALKDHNDQVTGVVFDGEAAKVQAKQDALDAAPPEAQFQAQLDLLNAQEAAEVASAEETGRNVNNIHAKYAKARDGIIDNGNENTLRSTKAMLSNLASLFGKHTAAFKAISAAKALIDTYQAANAAYKTALEIPVGGLTLAPIAAGLAVAAGLENVRQILSTKTEFRKGGYYDGAGYTGDGSPSGVSTQVGVKPYIYHNQEYILSQPLLENPVIGGFIRNVVEPIRRQGLRGSMSSTGSFAGGGFAPVNTQGAIIVQSVSPEALQSSIESALSKMQIYTSVTDINRGQGNFAKVVGKGVH